MWISLGAWGFDEGFGKRCRVESITGFVGLERILKKLGNWWNLLPHGV